ncbi:extracellular solute-binding protein [Pseudonocardia petroleophila]|uniref:Extracellular solute-binding protein n=1 Tax=Pseudonocardia petroleophila TaxID=37331 RepID=A0A7G7MSP2_9PSEU|nr:extracellular solute-binding protein [Pseudonocardia petroleophila]
MLAGCALPGTTRAGGAAPGGGGASGPALVPAPARPASGEISFAHWRGEDRAVLDGIIAAFVAENPGAAVRQDISPSSDYQSTALLRIRRGGTGDVFTAFRGAQFVDMVDAGLYGDLSAQPFTDGYLPRLVRSGRDAQGNQLGLPYQYVFNMPLVNTDLLAAAGASSAPADWDGFLALCESLRGLGIAPIAWPGGEPANAGQLLNAMVMNNAPTDDMFTAIEAGTARVTDDWFLTTLRQYAQLAPYFQDGALGASSEPCQQVFASGGAAMLATGSFHLTAVRTLGAAFPIDLIAPITVDAGAARHQGVANATFLVGVSTSSEKQDAAVAFVEFLSRPEVASRYANGTVQHSTVAGVEYTDPDLRATARWLDAPVILAPRFQFENLDIRSAVENACVEVVRGVPPEQAAESAQTVVDQRRPG